MKKTIYAIILIIISGLVFAGCTYNGTQRTANKLYREQQARQDQDMSVLLKKQPAVTPSYSSERDNINERNMRYSDPNKISYFYAVALDGTPIAHWTVKGKVSSCSSQINPSEQPVTVNSSHYTLPAPEPDGSYGTNGDCVFFFTTQGAYVEWRGDYAVSDQPLTITSQPKLVVSANAQVTASKHDDKWAQHN